MSPEALYFLAGLALIVFNLTWNLKRKGKFELSSRWEEIDLQSLELERKRYYAGMDNKLIEFGFSFYKMTLHQNGTARILQRIYISREHPEIFTVMESWAPNVKTRRPFSWKTRFTDGYYLVTSAPRTSSGMAARLPNRIVQSFWEYKEPGELLQIHRSKLQSLTKVPERIYPERYPMEITEEREAFLKRQLETGNLIPVPGQDHYTYSWKYAFRNVLILVNPFGRSFGAPAQWVKMICAGLLFYSVIFFSDAVRQGLSGLRLPWAQSLNPLYSCVAFFSGGLLLRTLGVKKLIAAYMLAFFPMTWVFDHSMAGGLACFFLLISGFAKTTKMTQQEKA